MVHILLMRSMLPSQDGWLNRAPIYRRRGREAGHARRAEDDVAADRHTYTRPDEVEDFIKTTGWNNIDSDGRLVVTSQIRQISARQPEEFDPREYLGPAREALLGLCREKNLNVLGSAGRAQEIMKE